MKSKKTCGGAGSTSLSIPLLAAFNAVDDEPEYLGEMPDEIYEAIRQHKNTMEEALRISVRLTKRAIRLRLEQAAYCGKKARHR